MFVINNVLFGQSFEQVLKDGILEIISPPASFYPDMRDVKANLGDPVERVRWRSKQNLDYAFLMMYALKRGVYYVQLEDDIQTKPGYISQIKKFVQENNSLNSDWFLLDFCQLGFIGNLSEGIFEKTLLTRSANNLNFYDFAPGKLLKSADLPYLIYYTIMFYKDKPVDWLFEPIIETKYCPRGEVSKSC